MECQEGEQMMAIFIFGGTVAWLSTFLNKLRLMSTFQTFKYYSVHTNGVMWILTSKFLEVWSWKGFVTSPSVESERSRISLWLFLELEAVFFMDLMPLWWSGRLESVVMRTSVTLVLTRRTRARGRGCEMERLVCLENAWSKHVFFCCQITSKWKAIQLISVMYSAVLCWTKEAATNYTSVFFF